ncbi:hypothetical protein [Arabiibacter massiliensis]|uniref:hypothetical protein n=1 Tax=Arabiibacter massiliensis TaxID=1870985 RepID=UPI0009B96262|nr:hypothetical protein [Arabiibacter massiliensis]
MAGDRTRMCEEAGARIVLAHAGTGKSHCAKVQPERFADLPCMPYKYLMEELREDESEALKASYPVEAMNPEYPRNYLAALLDAREKGGCEYVFAPPDYRVAAYLEAWGVPYLLAYPERELKDEYERRYIERGNGEEFLRIFIGGWDRFMDLMDALNPTERIRLGSGQYLLDVL